MQTQSQTSNICSCNCCRFIYLMSVMLLAVAIIAQCVIYSKPKQANGSVIKIVGNAEKDIEADIVVAPINFVMASNELNKLPEEFKKKIGTFKDFLSQNNIMLNDLEVSIPSVYPQYDQSIENGVDRADKKFIVKALLSIKSKDIEKVEKIIAQLPKLNTTTDTEITLNTYQADYQISPDLLRATAGELAAKAAENAMENAERVAKRIDAKIVGVKNIACEGAVIVNPFLSAPQTKNKKISTTATVEIKIKPHKKKMASQKQTSPA